MKKTLITLLGIVLFGAAVAVEKPAGATMEQYVDALMRRMTLEEKIGQLNLPSAGDITTGQAKSSDIAEKIRRGGWAVCSISRGWRRSATCSASPSRRAVWVFR